MSTHHCDYAGRALVKADRAADLFSSLDELVDRWNEEHQLMAPARTPHDGDPRLEVFRPDDLEQIPWNMWESIFHDGVHNLRVVLDSFCFDLCRLTDDPGKPRNIYFPITGHPNAWADKAAPLSRMPASLLERVRQCQPWARPDPQEPDPLKLISLIDNKDKHESEGVTFDVLPLLQSELPTEPVPQELAQSPDWPLVPWASLDFDSPVERGQAGLIPTRVLPIVTFRGFGACLPDAQRWLYSEVRRVVLFIASGEWPDAGFNRVLPEPTWWTV
jgi:hypothetical protein